MIETNSFKPGDSVWLNSGSPPLTVVQLHDNGRVTVTWSEDGQPKEETFPAACLCATERTIDT